MIDNKYVSMWVGLHLNKEDFEYDFFQNGIKVGSVFLEK